MSVVAVKVYDDRIEMSADSIIVCGGRKELFYGCHTKINHINDMIIGAAGTCEELGLMWMYAKNHRPVSATERDVLDFIMEFADWKRARTGNSTIDCNYLLAYDGKAFHIQNYMILEVDKYSSVGAGADYALAALYLDKTAPEAVKVACDLSCYVSEPITTYVMERKSKDDK
jgi:ATP-dependent protease HslVU (ClpYQ) peptidase subunit